MLCVVKVVYKWGWFWPGLKKIPVPLANAANATLPAFGAPTWKSAWSKSQVVTYLCGTLSPPLQISGVPQLDR